MVIGTLKLSDYGMFTFTLLLQFLPLQVSNIKIYIFMGPSNFRGDAIKIASVGATMKEIK